jgi:hypothetical protein
MKRYALRRLLILPLLPAPVRRLHRKGLNARADAAARMPNVLPPHPAGAFAALRAAPAAELAIFMHTGHDELLNAASV